MFEFDSDIINRLTTSRKRRILLEGREIFVVFAIVIFTLGLMIMLGGEGLWGMWFIILALVLFIASASRILFMNSAKQDRFIMASLVEKSIRRTERKTGKVFSEAERDKIRFKYDPIFHDQITAHSCKHLQSRHRQKIIHLRQELKFLERERGFELEKLKRLRWQNTGTRDLYYSLEEGKVRINQNIVCDFSELKRAVLVLNTNQRYAKRVSGSAVKQRCRIARNKAKTKIDQQVGKHIKSQNPGVEEILPESTAIPIAKTELMTKYPVSICGQLGVKIEFQDNTSTVVMLLPNTVDWRNKKCQKAYRLARQIENELQLLINTPQPSKALSVEQSSIIKDYDRKIKRIRKRLRAAETEIPQPEIPSRYLYDQDCLSLGNDVK